MKEAVERFVEEQMEQQVEEKQTIAWAQVKQLQAQVLFDSRIKNDKHIMGVREIKHNTLFAKKMMIKVEMNVPHDNADRRHRMEVEPRHMPCTITQKNIPLYFYELKTRKYIYIFQKNDLRSWTRIIKEIENQIFIFRNSW